MMILIYYLPIFVGLVGLYVASFYLIDAQANFSRNHTSVRR